MQRQRRFCSREEEAKLIDVNLKDHILPGTCIISDDCHSTGRRYPLRASPSSPEAHRSHPGANAQTAGT
jgi:hypothetical protein